MVDLRDLFRPLCGKVRKGGCAPAVAQNFEFVPHLIVFDADIARNIDNLDAAQILRRDFDQHIFPSHLRDRRRFFRSAGPGCADDRFRAVM